MNALKTSLFFVGCVLTTLVATAVFFGISYFSGYSLHSLSLWIVVPVGALIYGGLAASGAFLVARKLHLKVSSLKEGMVLGLLTIVGYFLIYFIEYSILRDGNGQLISQSMGFSTFLNLLITESKHTVLAYGVHDLGSIGMAGYVTFAIDALGAFSGGMLVAAVLEGTPYCKSCSKYKSGAGGTTRFYDSARDSELKDLLSSRSDVAEHQKRVAPLIRSGADAERPDSKLKIELTKYLCPICSEVTMCESVYAKNEKGAWSGKESSFFFVATADVGC